MHRSKRQPAAVREAQTQTPLTPDLYQKPTPAPTPTAAELAEQREERIEADVRSRAEVFEARHFMQVAERERDVAKATLVEERAAMQAQFVLLQSRAEKAEQELVRTRFAMRELIQKTYADELKAGIERGDIIVAEPKKSEEEK
jgi:hypothetical protein